LIVVDSQMLVYLTTTGAFTDVASRVRQKDPEWASPPLWRSEFRSVLAGYMRRGDLEAEAALRTVALAADLLSVERAPRDSDVLDLVLASPCSAYDLEFVALARVLGVQLVTNDRQVLSAFPTIAISPEAFVA
jgi:predicted nucleic acid-binding protein